VLAETRLPSLSILDVGAASGDGIDAVRNATGVAIRGTLLDRVPAHFNGYPGPKVAADALALPFRDQSFDIVTCSLFAHHLEPEEIILFAEEALRVSRVALLINDLTRSYFHLGLIYAGLPLFRSRATRHDSVASVERSYTSLEMQHILEHTSAARVEVHQTFLCRMGAIAWK
jgi:Methyltransferase domain